MSRPIQEGDFVEVLVSEDSSLYPLVHFRSTGQRKKFRVLSMPQDSGDMWYLDSAEGPLAINPSSAHLDAILKAQQ